MKRLIAYALLFIMFTPTSFSEGIDLGTYNLEELVMLQVQIDTELGNRFGEGWVRLGAGAYTAGENIKAGSYEIICTQAERFGGEPYFKLFLYESVERLKENEISILVAFAAGPGDVFSVSLKEGMVLQVLNGSGIIRKAPNFFMP
jgi:hypothetical protein